MKTPHFSLADTLRIVKKSITHLNGNHWNIYIYATLGKTYIIMYGFKLVHTHNSQRINNYQ